MLLKRYHAQGEILRQGWEPGPSGAARREEGRTNSEWRTTRPEAPAEGGAQ